MTVVNNMSDVKRIIEMIEENNKYIKACMDIIRNNDKHIHETSIEIEEILKKAKELRSNK